MKWIELFVGSDCRFNCENNARFLKLSAVVFPATVAVSVVVVLQDFLSHVVVSAKYTLALNPGKQSTFVASKNPIRTFTFETHVLIRSSHSFRRTWCPSNFKPGVRSFHSPRFDWPKERWCGVSWKWKTQNKSKNTYVSRFPLLETMDTIVLFRKIE